MAPSNSPSSPDVRRRHATDTTSVTTSKRQRVSLACDHCRAVRGRCDGRRPSCGACLAQHRDCSYTSSRRRRGTPTGYLRAIESSLAYLVQQSPNNAKLLECLLKNGTDIFASHPNPAADHLHKQWTNSRFRKDMWCLLVDGYRSEHDTDGSVMDDESTSIRGTSIGRTSIGSNDVLRIIPGPRSTLPPELPDSTRTSVATSSSSAMSQQQPNAHLPTNWEHLVDVYFAYTHCWLPILDRETVMDAALSFPANGISTSQMANVPSMYAELWAVLALASFQDSDPMSNHDPTGPPNPCPHTIYSAARNMMPSEEKRFELPHLRALLLHSLVLMGQGSGLAAWMLIGTAVRLALHLRETGDLYTYGGQSSPSPAGHLAFAASLALNTLASAYLGQPTFLSVDTEQLTASINAMGNSSQDEVWASATGDVPPAQVNPIKTFRQLYKMTQILSAHRANSSSAKPTTAQALIDCLDPEFSFCNSVILGRTTPTIPSAFVLHACFLTVLTQCEPGRRSSLLSSLREVIESCVSTFGPRGVPPVVVCLAGTALRSRHANRIEVGERSKWERVAGHLRMVWTGRTGGRGRLETPAAVSQSSADSNLAPATPAALHSDAGSILGMQLDANSVDFDMATATAGTLWVGEHTAAHDPFLSDMGPTWLNGGTPPYMP
ncbi:Fungal Zn(2)-Cys(6) binuclear cluster domain [Geosmithia morbida]|uniref:Fungal Zn(2)-Cys(6) binuclear cluster domain n=1 Tax=Geosmithia morbida TaxID=1094350 RepID=A0A9P4YRP9_9HYPO|nr:Fungal Zn(2)-Cys(6) binuclear cluster domain [Geosmithia morbida]KAF4120850.1 Fungal Zn(2)-Cys(6) binuclear cluster domain [Geosmithia morbida]